MCKSFTFPYSPYLNAMFSTTNEQHFIPLMFEQRLYLFWKNNNSVPLIGVSMQLLYLETGKSFTACKLAYIFYSEKSNLFLSKQSICLVFITIRVIDLSSIALPAFRIEVLIHFSISNFCFICKEKIENCVNSIYDEIDQFFVKMGWCRLPIRQF